MMDQDDLNEYYREDMINFIRIAKAVAYGICWFLIGFTLAWCVDKCFG